MAKPMPAFQFKFPAPVEQKPPFVQVIYGGDPLDPVPLEAAKRYSRSIVSNLPNAVSPVSDLCVENLPLDETIPLADVQIVIRALNEGEVSMTMGQRLGVMRACRLLGVDRLRKAIEEHLNKGCKNRPTLKLECLQEVFDLPPKNHFRRARMKDARENFYAVVNNPLWPKLNADIVRELFNDDIDLKISEMDLYRGVLRWLANNPSKLAGQSDRLFSTIRFGSMSTKEKFSCLDEARQLGLDDFVKPYLIEANWYRTCLELNHPEFTETVEYDRLSHFVGENRRLKAIGDHRIRKSSPKIETGPVLQRVLEGSIDGGTWLQRPRKARKRSV